MAASRRGRVLAGLVLATLAGAAGSARADDGGGFSAWNIQGLYGTEFHEPFNPEDVSKLTFTIENASAWSWGSSFFFIDNLYSTENDHGAVELYAEWFPSASLGKMTGSDLSAGPIKDVSLTFGFNLGRKSTGAHPLVYLPGVTLDLNLPGFAFATLGVYAYIDRGTLEGEGNGCHANAVQITPAWMLPFSVGGADFQFGGFIDYISSHGTCAEQVVSQPQLTMDVGKAFGGTAGKFYMGIEYQYWSNKFGLKGLDEHFPEFLTIYRF